MCPLVADFFWWFWCLGRSDSNANRCRVMFPTWKAHALSSSQKVSKCHIYNLSSYQNCQESSLTNTSHGFFRRLHYLRPFLFALITIFWYIVCNCRCWCIAFALVTISRSIVRNQRYRHILFALVAHADYLPVSMTSSLGSSASLTCHDPQLQLHPALGTMP